MLDKLFILRRSGSWLALQTMTRPLTTEQSVEDQQILLFLNKIIFLFDDCELHREHANIH